MFISYAQNCEDVVLWRVLRNVKNGTYVDVGAADPTEYSVTKAFYDRGWSGVNVEPSPEFAEKLNAERTRDLNFPFCAGEAAGTTVFHVVPGTGLSTASNEHLEFIARQNFEIVDLEIEVKRLDEILTLADLVDRDIHFLKIDVEGAEESVIRGIDLETWRPWVIVIEATEPLSTTQTHGRWDSLLTNSNYNFCLFDGLNRFYAAAEHPELFGPLSYPAGVFDQPYTVGAGANEIAARAEELIASRDALASANNAIEEELKNTVRGYRELHDRYDGAIASYQKLELATLATDRQLQVLQEAHSAALEMITEHERVIAEHERVIAEHERVIPEQAVAQLTYDGLHEQYRQTLAAYQSTEHELQVSLASAEAHLTAIEHSMSWILTKPLRAIRRLGHR